MLNLGVSQRILQRIKEIDDLASWASALVLLAANMAATVYIMIAIVCLVASLFPHPNGSILFVISLGALLLTSFVMCKSMVKLWPWRDTLLAILWVAWQAFGYQGHRWESWAIGWAILFALSATLRWRVYFMNRQSMISARIS